MNKRALNENYIIRIKSRVEQDGEPQTIELMTRGSFVLKNGSFYITYKETEATGYEGCVTTLKLAADSSRVAMMRFGHASTQLVIEKARRSLCHYETGYGAMTLGVTADEIECGLTEKGGSARFSYLLDAGDAGTMSHNALEITVSHIN